MGRTTIAAILGCALAACTTQAGPGDRPQGNAGGREEGGEMKATKSPSREELKTTEPKAKAVQEVAILAGGCFWGMEDILRKIPGVIGTEVGYTGGSLEGPRYEEVKTGKTGHAESIRIAFDPQVLSYEAVLGTFFRMHDPTTPNRQGNDMGTQYRSVIFTTSEEQARVAKEVKERVDKSGKWKRPVVTEIRPAGPFYPAEEYHQDYLEKHPGGYTCHFLRD